METWSYDESGYALNPDEKSMAVRSVAEPVSYDGDGEPEDWRADGFFNSMGNTEKSLRISGTLFLYFRNTLYFSTPRISSTPQSR
ncbi:hypothetical protein C805_00738 [Eubacterium sp. 14-2]|nr:hypothetical protein C805_00738 [Eubacterium sp. 14-2]